MQRSTERLDKKLALKAVFLLSLLWAMAFNGASLQARTKAVAGGSVAVAATRNWRLPDNCLPESYDLKIEPDLTGGTFKGAEAIRLRLNKATRTITVNAVDLKITGVTISSRALKSLTGNVRLDRQTECATISFPCLIAPGQYSLRLAFQGILNDKLVGFYRSTFTDRQGAKHNLAATQMEPTDARRMFPCFDEPALKSRFKITVAIPKGLRAISNAPVLKESLDRAKGKKVVEFAETAPMSTYLVALVVGDFEAGAPVMVEGVPVRVWAVRGKEHLGAYAQMLAGKLLPFFNSYFKISYPWKKLDLIAVPDFEAGAMENPGAITFRENLLLVDEAASCQENKREVASTIAHEMAHMWFGDLVTMKWWDDLWLNEAFATWMSTKAVDAIMPQWEFWKGYAVSRLHALETDSLLSTRPIHFQVSRPSEANEMFDVITYSKGASVLRMLETYVKADVFQEGVHRYLAGHAYASATTCDLWRAIGEASGLPVDRIMHGWVYQPGYPLVSVEPACAGGSLLLLQKRFLLNPPEGKSCELWKIPVGWRALEAERSPANWQATEVKLIESRSQPLSVDRLAGSEPGKDELSGGRAGAPACIANAGFDGYYRVHYGEDLLKSILPAIESKLGPLERLELLSDQFALLRAGLCSVGDYLDVVRRYKNETDDVVWKSLLSEIDYLDYFIDDSSRPSFEKFVQDELKSVKGRLGWTAAPDESPLTQLVRSRVLLALGTIAQDRETIARARKLFASYLADEKSVDPDLLDAVTSIVAFNGDRQDWKTFRRLFKNARTPEAEMRNLGALASFRKPELLRETLDMTLCPAVRTQDAPHLLADVLSARAGGQMAWKFMTANWQRILRTYSQQMVPHMVSGAANFSTSNMQRVLKDFFDSHKIVDCKSTVARTLETVQVNVRFRQLSAAALNEWFRLKYPPASARRNMGNEM